MSEERLRRAVRHIPDFPSPGIQFKDITPILADRTLLREALDALVKPYSNQGITHVLAIEARGFFFGAGIAERLGAGLIPARKPGKLPSHTISEAYALEYGTDNIEIHADGLTNGARVLIHDDVIATGGTAAAAARLAEKSGGQVVGFSFLVELGFLNGRAKLPEGIPVHSVLAY